VYRTIHEISESAETHCYIGNYIALVTKLGNFLQVGVALR